MKQLKVLADYRAWPVWWNDGVNFGDIDTSEFKITSSLRERLDAWAGRYTATMDWYNPYNAGFETEEDIASFFHEGRRLTEELQSELGPEFTVTYAVSIERLGLKSDI